MKRNNIYKCECGFVTTEFKEFLEHFARHMEFELMHYQLKKELEDKNLVQ